MLIAGAGGHARELAGILAEKEHALQIRFYDDVSASPPAMIWDRFPVLHTIEAATEWFRTDPRFAIGVGKPAARKALYNKLIRAGGIPVSVISPLARIGRFNIILEEGLNIMTGAVITEDIRIGKGSLIHIHVSVHHDCEIGEFCELSPGCRILGKVTIGNSVSVGTNASILPGITIGDDAVIGAGAVVTSSVPAGKTVKGVPAR